MITLSVWYLYDTLVCMHDMADVMVCRDHSAAQCVVVLVFKDKLSHPCPCPWQQCWFDSDGRLWLHCVQAVFEVTLKTPERVSVQQFISIDNTSTSVTLSPLTTHYTQVSHLIARVLSLYSGWVGLPIALTLSTLTGVQCSFTARRSVGVWQS